VLLVPRGTKVIPAPLVPRAHKARQARKETRATPALQGLLDRKARQAALVSLSISAPASAKASQFLILPRQGSVSWER